MNAFKTLEPYGGNTVTQKQCQVCKQWVPVFLPLCLCDPDYDGKKRLLETLRVKDDR